MRVRIKSLIVFFLVLLRASVCGSAKKVSVSPKRICIFQSGKLGDMVCTTPVFRAVKDRYPESVLYVVGDAVNERVLNDHPDVDEYLIFSGSTFSFIRILQKHRIEFAALATPNFIAFCSLYLAGVRSIAAPIVENGRSPYETRLYRIVRRLAFLVPHRMGYYAPREYLRLLEPIGIHAVDTTKHLAYSDAANKRIDRLFREEQIMPGEFLLGISPSAGNKIKCWGATKFARLSDEISRRHKLRIVIIGGPKDESEVSAMLNAVSEKRNIVNTFGKLSIDELKALMARLQAFIAVDTGPIYIAEAFGVPTVDIIGPIDEKEQPPIGEKHKIVVAERKKPELYVLNAREYNEEEAKRQSEAITVDMVLAAFEELYANIY